MTHALQTSQTQPPAPDQAVAQLTPLLRSPLATLNDRNHVASQIAALSAPASPVWILARVAALLSPYYEKDTPQAVREMEAEDWLHALSGQPQWAITAAVRWWLGADNKDRRRRPMQGDIADRVAVETMALRAGKIRIEAFDAGLLLPKPAPAPREEVSPADMAQRREFADRLIKSNFPSQREAMQ